MINADSIGGAANVQSAPNLAENMPKLSSMTAGFIDIFDAVASTPERDCDAPETQSEDAEEPELLWAAGVVQTNWPPAAPVGVDPGAQPQQLVVDAAMPVTLIRHIVQQQTQNQAQQAAQQWGAQLGMQSAANLVNPAAGVSSAAIQMRFHLSPEFLGRVDVALDLPTIENAARADGLSPATSGVLRIITETSAAARIMLAHRDALQSAAQANGLDIVTPQIGVRAERSSGPPTPSADLAAPPTPSLPTPSLPTPSLTAPTLTAHNFGGQDSAARHYPRTPPVIYAQPARAADQPGPGTAPAPRRPGHMRGAGRDLFA